MVGEFNVMWDISNDSNLLFAGNPKVEIRKLIMRMLMKNTIAGAAFWVFGSQFLGFFSPRDAKILVSSEYPNDEWEFFTS